MYTTLFIFASLHITIFVLGLEKSHLNIFMVFTLLVPIKAAHTVEHTLDDSASVHNLWWIAIFPNSSYQPCHPMYVPGIRQIFSFSMQTAEMAKPERGGK